MASDLEKFVAELRKIVGQGDEYGRRAEPDATLIEAAADMLEALHYHARHNVDNGPLMAIRTRIDTMAADAMAKPGENSTQGDGGGNDKKPLDT